MKILLVGNKPSDVKIDYSSYDKIVHVNRLYNFKNVPVIDIWYCDCHREFFKLESDIWKSGYDFTGTEILVPKQRWKAHHRVIQRMPLAGRGLFKPFSLNNKMTSEAIQGQTTERNVLTSEIIVLIYLLETYPDDSITISYLDVENRGEVMSNLHSHKGTYHENAVYDEEVFLKKLIHEGRIQCLSDTCSN